jgi:hypothetical protein
MSDRLLYAARNDMRIWFDIKKNSDRFLENVESWKHWTLKFRSQLVGYQKRGSEHFIRIGRALDKHIQELPWLNFMYKSQLCKMSMSMAADQKVHVKHFPHSSGFSEGDLKGQTLSRE